MTGERYLDIVTLPAQFFTVENFSLSKTYLSIIRPRYFQF